MERLRAGRERSSDRPAPGDPGGRGGVEVLLALGQDELWKDSGKSVVGDGPQGKQQALRDKMTLTS